LDAVEYKELLGIDNERTPKIAPQVAALKLDNFILTRQLGGYIKRGGSSKYDVTGDIWGFTGYAKQELSPRVPTRDIPIRHRRAGATSFIEKLDWSADTWSAITQGSHVNFDIGDIMSGAMIGDLLCLCANRPAKITDIDSGNVTRLGGSAPSAAPTLAEGVAGNLTGTYRYVITFYDSTTGWESSPSDISSSLTVTAKKIELSAIPTTIDRTGIDKVKIYRTIGTGEAPYRPVATINLGTTTYSDDIADSALPNTDTAPDFGDHDPPPDNAYIVAAYKQRLWIAVDNELYSSKPDDGTGVPLEYFSSLKRKEVFEEKITGLAPNRTGGMFVFQPPNFGIYEVIGRFTTAVDFEIQLAYPSEGTYFHGSIANGGVHDDEIHFFGRRGSTVITPSGIRRQNTRSLDDAFFDAMTQSYDGDAFCAAYWDSMLNQFIVSLALIDNGATAWKESGTDLSTFWVNATTGDRVNWEIVT
jgi:hypothetical protein